MAEKTFEQMMSELSHLVAQLEVGDLSLEKSLQLYEQGVSLVGSCSTKLQDAQLKVEELTVEDSANG